MRADLIRLIDEVRVLEHRLVMAAETLHGSEEVSIPGRAVLEYLQRSGPTAVPDIARARSVSRQHIQTIVDVLAEGELVRRQTNPAHRRSPLIALTETGAATIGSMLERESRALDQHMATIEEHEVRTAIAVLEAMRVALDDIEPR